MYTKCSKKIEPKLLLVTGKKELFVHIFFLCGVVLVEREREGKKV